MFELLFFNKVNPHRPDLLFRSEPNNLARRNSNAPNSLSSSGANSNSNNSSLGSSQTTSNSPRVGSAPNGKILCVSGTVVKAKHNFDGDARCLSLKKGDVVHLIDW